MGRGDAVRRSLCVGRRIPAQLAMKGFYCQMRESGQEVKFVFQEKGAPVSVGEHYVKVQVKACALSHVDTKLLSVLQLQKKLIPVGREIAGIVLDVGPKVTFFQSDDEVVVHKPEKVTWVEAAGTMRDGLRSYTALHSLAHITAGNTVLVVDGASPFGTIAIQLAHHVGARVIATAHSTEDKTHLEGLRPKVGIRQPLVARVINVSDGKADLVECCLEETGGLGVDIVLDAGVRLYSKEDESTNKSLLLPHKHDIITLLAVGSHWVTTEENLQLDPPDSCSLFLKGATVAFLNDEVWNLSSMLQGKYLHILKDVMEKLSNEIFRPQLDEPVPLYEAMVSMEMVQKNQARKRQVIQL
uniref:Crystallin zeta like 1 n=1 Tax=Latimeria chalumnae TaxID=7897 RepID=M3XK34_LATCH